MGRHDKHDKHDKQEKHKDHVGKSNKKYYNLISINKNEFSLPSIIPTDVEKYFSQLLNKDKSLSAGIAAIKTLLMVLEKSKCKSME